MCVLRDPLPLAMADRMYVVRWCRYFYIYDYSGLASKSIAEKGGGPFCVGAGVYPRRSAARAGGRAGSGTWRPLARECVEDTGHAIFVRG